MSYTITDDGDEINIRATITQRWELAELVTKLQQRVDGLAVNLTTYVGVAGPYDSKETLNMALKDQGYEIDAQDVNRKELSNER